MVIVYLVLTRPQEAFKIMGLSDEEILPVWKVVASVLHLGKLIQTVSADRAGEQAVIKDDQGGYLA